MKSKISPEQNPNRRKKALVWLILSAAAVAALLYFEQVAVIYVLATVGLIILLLAVAFADLEKVGQNGESVETNTNLSENNSQSNSKT